MLPVELWRTCMQPKTFGALLSVIRIFKQMTNYYSYWVSYKVRYSFWVTVMTFKYRCCSRCIWLGAARSIWWTSYCRALCCPSSCSWCSVFLLTLGKRSQLEFPCCWRSQCFCSCWPTACRELRLMFLSSVSFFYYDMSLFQSDIISQRNCKITEQKPSEMTRFRAYVSNRMFTILWSNWVFADRKVWINSSSLTFEAVPKCVHCPLLVRRDVVGPLQREKENKDLKNVMLDYNARLKLQLLFVPIVSYNVRCCVVSDLPRHDDDAWYGVSLSDRLRP